VTFNPGDVVTVDFPGVTGIKRRPAVVLSSDAYHAVRPDTIVGLITTQTTALGATDYVLQEQRYTKSIHKARVFPNN
jgi:mRNA interferase MazF